MRNIIIYILLLAPVLCMGQELVRNGDFNAPLGPNCSNGAAFHAGCVPYWFASHGTPAAFFRQSNPSEGYFAHLSGDACPGVVGLERTEGVYNNLSGEGVVIGKTYQLSIDIQYYDPQSTGIDVILTNTLRPFDGELDDFVIQDPFGGNRCAEGRAIPPTPGYKILEIREPGPGDFQTYTVEFTSPGCFSQIWILRRQTNLNGYLAINVDNISLQEVCRPVVYYQNSSNLPNFTKASDKIIAGSNVISGQPTGPVVIRSGQHVVFQAANEIDIQPGVIVEPGGIFETIIAPCEGNPGAPAISEIQLQSSLVNTCGYRISPIFTCFHYNKTFTYKWANDLGTSSSIVVNPLVPTSYSVEITDQDGNKYIGNIDLNSRVTSITSQANQCGYNLSICPGESNLSFRWFWAEQPGSNEVQLGTSSSINVYPVQDARYYVEVTDNITGEKRLFSRQVQAHPLAITSSQNCSVPLTFTASFCNVSELDFVWSGSSEKDNQISVGSSTPYTQTLTVTDKITGKSVTKSIQVRPVYGFRLNTAAGEKEVYPRNSFTPNGDVANSIWFVEEENLHKKNTYAYSAYGYRLIIKNRWGNTVYERSELRGHSGFKERDIYWDGRNNNGNMLPSMTSYYYILDLYRCDGTKSFNGWIYMQGATSKLSYEGYEDNVAEKEGHVSANKIYPNPTTGTVTITSAGEFSAYLTDMKGAIVKTAENADKIVRLDLSDLSSGIYTVKIVTEHGVTFEKITFQP